MHRVENGQTYIQVFDAENRLISVTVSGRTTQFLYDGNGNLVKKIKPDGSKTIYGGGICEVDKSSSGGMRINCTLYYILKDHLGSASVITDASGNVVGEQRYYPFGETRLSTGSIFTDKLNTGQHAMSNLVPITMEQDSIRPSKDASSALIQSYPIRYPLKISIVSAMCGPIRFNVSNRPDIWQIMAVAGVKDVVL